MTEKRIKSVVDAAEQGRRKGQKTRAELIDANEALLQKVKYLQEQNAYLDGQRRSFADKVEELQTEVDKLRKSREAWVLKCEELTGMHEKAKKANSAIVKEYSKLFKEQAQLLAHPWKNLWRYLKELVGLGG